MASDLDDAVLNEWTIVTRRERPVEASAPDERSWWVGLPADTFYDEARRRHPEQKAKLRTAWTHRYSSAEGRG